MSMLRRSRRLHAVLFLSLLSVGPTATGQNLLINGGFEQTSVAGSVSGCCEVIDSLPAGGDTLPGWTLSGTGAELRGRESTCLDGPAEGGRWLRLGQGVGGGSLSQVFSTTPGMRHAVRFRRWVESPSGAMASLTISAPGFSATLFIPPDGTPCASQVAMRTSVEFTAVDESSLVRFETFGGPADRHLLLDAVEVIEVRDCDQDGIADGFAILDGLVEDLDGDGVPDRCRCRSDFDGDGWVGGMELGLLFGSWGTKDALADLDGDGLVGSADLSILLGDWGACS